jgi:diaminohydroxyphosphoribosylaminopyrimidine deaminase/5-amino-6-(5-phosphoribosylamino)uracil reductase
MTTQNRSLAAGIEQRVLMQEALAEAQKGRGKTYPNPAVGAVVARDDRIVGRGFHKRWGKPHAEVEALRDAGPRSRGADLYVTLEPCSHWGRTPPCTDAIIAGGIRRVFVPCLDPNRLVRGRGVAALRRAGIEVSVGLEARSARKLNEAYFKFMKTGRPFVTLKIAQTLDGKIATRKGEARWVTGSKSRNLAKRMRGEAQAIMVGVNTVINDDPGLLPIPRRKAYYRCVLDTNLSTPPERRVVETAELHPTIIYCADSEGRKARKLEAKGVKVKRVATSGDGLLRLEAVLADLASLGVMHVFVEGGSRVSSSLLGAGLVDKVIDFIAPKVLGDVNGLGAFCKLDVKNLKTCYGFRLDEFHTVGGDAIMVLYPKGRTGG